MNKCCSKNIRTNKKDVIWWKNLKLLFTGLPDLLEYTAIYLCHEKCHFLCFRGNRFDVQCAHIVEDTIKRKWTTPLSHCKGVNVLFSSNVKAFSITKKSIPNLSQENLTFVNVLFTSPSSS